MSFVADASCNDVSVIIAHLVQTSAAAPSQWEGSLADNRPVFIRYRWGTLQIQIGPSGGGVSSAISATPWFDKEVGEKMGAFIELDDVLQYSGLQLA